MLDVVQRYLPQLFSERPKPLTHGTHVFDTMITVKAQPAELDEAIRMLDGVLNGHQGLIDLTFSARCPAACRRRRPRPGPGRPGAIVKLMSSSSICVLANFEADEERNQ